MSHEPARRSMLVAATLVALVAGTATVAAAPVPGASAADEAWSAPRNVYGQPDLAGVWANNNATPLERPEALGDRETLTQEELRRIQAKADQLFALDAGDAAFGDSVFNAALADVEDFTSRDGGTGNYNQFWLAERDWDNRTSLIVDPPNGRIPELTAAGKERAAERREARLRPAQGPEDRSLGERCITFGVPRLGAGYNSYTHIIQSADHVVFVMEMIHDARVVPISDAPHVDGDIHLWHGDARAHWEGETLVVETRNFSDGGGFYGGTSSSFTLVERFTRVAPDVLEYVATLDDPDTWTRPWTVRIPLKRSDDPIYEYACHEGNEGMHGILAGARAEEAAAASASR